MTVVNFDPGSEPLRLTATARAYFVKKLAAQAGKIIRLSTKKSGCTGFTYVLDFVEKSEPDDEILSFPETTLVIAIDAEALQMLRGTEIDLVTEGINKVVKFNNPNVTAECGCGESFSVE